MKSAKTIFFLYLVCIWGFWPATLSAQGIVTPDTIPQTTPDTLIVTPADTLSDTTLVNALDTLPEVMISPSALAAEVVYSAQDSVIFEVEARRVHLYGGADITYQNIHLTAAYVFIDFEQSTVHAQGMEDTLGVLQGRPVFTEGDHEFRSNRMSYNFSTRRGITYDVITEEGDGYIHGERVKKDEHDILHIHKARYTTCDLEEPHFHITARRAKVIPNRQIVTGPAYLVIQDVPLFPFVLPFGFFPNNQRQASGIIIPSYGADYGMLNRGYYLRNGGYFVTVNDYMNFSVLGDIYARGDYRVELASNYALRYRFSGNLRLQHAMMFQGDPDIDGRFGERQFLVKWNHFQDPKARPGSTFNASVDFGTSGFNRAHSLNINEMVKSDMNSSISYMRRWQGSPFTFNSSLRHSQNIQTGTVSMSLPEMGFSMQRIQPLRRQIQTGGTRWYEDIDVSYNLKFKNDIETHDTLLFSPQVFDDFRYGLQHTIPISTNLRLLRYFNMTPNFRYDGWMYFEKQNLIYNTTDEKVDTFMVQTVSTLHEYSFSTNLNTTVYGTMNINRLGITAMRHVVSPNLSFRYKPDFGAPQYGYYREVQADTTGRIISYPVFEQGIYGQPRAGQEGMVSLSLNNNLEMKVRSARDTVTGTRLIKIMETFNISSGYNLLADSFHLEAIRIGGNTQLLERISLRFGGSLDPYVFDETLGRRIQVYEWDANRRIGRLTNANFSASTSLNPAARQELQPHRLPDPMAPMYYYAHRDHYMNFSIPWNLNVGYTYNYSHQGFEPFITQSVDFSGSFSLTDKWKIGFNSGYNITLNEPSITSIDIFRDLHCWEMRMDWIPFGAFRRYGFTIRVKSPVLKDLKYDIARESRGRF